ncbi:MAG: hypothetical protein HND56_03550 [Pseudomonadota bacterium]|nr:hypothetical protein [Pseudomonadota bacterium]QKK04153.1 MAG: hypothetical protein HND56_03550 [Pseudomonadota bacterium]
MTIRSLILTTALASFVSFGIPQTAEADSVMCTMDAKLCPDGSAVGRTGPNCEFAPCPGEDAGDDDMDDMDDMDDTDSDDTTMPEDAGESDDGAADDSMEDESE